MISFSATACQGSLKNPGETAGAFDFALMSKLTHGFWATQQQAPFATCCTPAECV